MIGTATFIRCRGSPITGEYPLISSTSSLARQTFSNCKFTEDLNQRLVLAEFSDYTSYNLIRLVSGSFDEYYWITDVRRSSTASGAVEFDISYNAPTSFYSSGEYVRGYWTKTPEYICKYLDDPVTSGAWIPNNKYQSWYKYTFTYGSNTYYLFWVQVTSTDNIYHSSTESGQYMVYAFPVALRSGWNAINLYDSGTIQTDDSGGTYYFPKLTDFMSNPEQYGLTASNIIDVSISEVIPYSFTLSTTSNASRKFSLNPQSGVISPIVLNGATATNNQLYRIANTGSLLEKEYTMNIGLSDYQRMTGKLQFRDTNGSIVCEIPKAMSTSGGLTVSMKIICDYTGMTHQLRIYPGYSTSSTLYEVYQFPTTHLPYIGSAWDEYVKYSLTYDRESMQNSIAYNNQSYEYRTAERAGNTAGSLVSMIDPFNFLTGGIGNALGSATSNAVSTAVDAKQTQLENKMLQFNQELQERRIQGQAGIKYNPTYGVGYITACLTDVDGLFVMIPAGATSNRYSDYADAYGYPAEGLLNLYVQEGYYKGMPLPDSTHTDTGVRYMQLVNDFMNGVRYVSPSYLSVPTSQTSVIYQ